MGAGRVVSELACVEEVGAARGGGEGDEGVQADAPVIVAGQNRAGAVPQEELRIHERPAAGGGAAKLERVGGAGRQGDRRPV